MNTVIINGSPKTGGNNSQYFVDEIKKLLKYTSVSEIRIKTPKISAHDFEVLVGADVLLLCFPLYVDSIPSQMLTTLTELEGFFKEKRRHNLKTPVVYSIVNCGFYEGKQTRIALRMVRNWTERAGLKWRQGVGIGGGEMLGNLESAPIGKGPKTSLGKALKELVENMQAGETGGNIYVNPNFPRFAFMAMGYLGWLGMAKANGLSVKELYTKPV